MEVADPLRLEGFTWLLRRLKDNTPKATMIAAKRRSSSAHSDTTHHPSIEIARRLRTHNGMKYPTAAVKWPLRAKAWV